jgi:hypothetical protein
MKSAATEAAAVEAATAETAAVTAAAEAAPATAVTAATTTATATPTRQRGAWLRHRQNRRERRNGNTQTACDADRFHPDLLLNRRLAGGCWSVTLGRTMEQSSPDDEIEFKRAAPHAARQRAAIASR